MVYVPRQLRADDPDVQARQSLTRRFAVIDDHQIFADLLVSGLSSAPDLECVGVAYEVPTGLGLVDEHRPDLVVMDYQFRGDDSDGIEATAVIVSRHPNCIVVLLTGHAGPELVGRAASAGASSLMPKNGSLDDLLAALRTARRGVMTVHHSLLSDVTPTPARPSARRVALSRREREVLALLTVGLDARAIADQLGISLNTCRGYIKTLLHKLDAHSQLEAVAIARRLDLSVSHDAR